MLILFPEYGYLPVNLVFLGFILKSVSFWGGNTKNFRMILTWELGY